MMSSWGGDIIRVDLCRVRHWIGPGLTIVEQASDFRGEGARRAATCDSREARKLLSRGEAPALKK